MQAWLPLLTLVAGEQCFEHLNLQQAALHRFQILVHGLRYPGRRPPLAPLLDPSRYMTGTCLIPTDLGFQFRRERTIDLVDKSLKMVFRRPDWLLRILFCEDAIAVRISLTILVSAC
jgi:hypothetical protein